MRVPECEYPLILWKNNRESKMEALIQQNQLTGPNSWDLLRWGLRIKANPLKTYQELHETFGDMAWMPWFRKRCLFVYHPDLIAHVLKENHTNYTKGDQYTELRPLLGEGLLTSEGELWRKQRRVMAKQFHPAAIADYIVTIKDLTERELRLPEGEIEISSVFNRLALDIAGQIFFGADVDQFSGEISEGLKYEMEKVVDRIRSAVNFPLNVPTPENLKRRAILKRMDRVVEGIMKNPSGDKPNVLSSLMKSGEIPEKQIRDEVMTLLMAGHETTSNLLTWITWYLALYPSWQKELRDDPGNLPKFEAVINETLRLMPPVPAIARMAMKDDVIGGMDVPAGTTVVCQQWVTHRDARWWREPLVWDPARFLNRPDKKDDFTFFPFARGPRGCIGEELARIETIHILATMVERYQWTLKPGFTPQPVHHLTLQSKNGMKIVVKAVQTFDSTG